jgi:UDP-2-acetamido-3-amino-2,3-dideoxy-glucuronate N-acetyltransferase
VFHHYIDDSAWLHPTALIDDPCHIGADVAIMAYSQLMGHVLVGNHTRIANHVTLHSGVMLGQYVKVMAHVDVVAGVVLEDDVYLGGHTTFVPRQRLKPQTSFMSQVTPTLLKKGSVIGPHSTLATGITLGDYSQTQPYSLVDASVPAYAVVAGNPARIVGWRCHCGHPLVVAVGIQLTQCGHCGTRYRYHGAHYLERLDGHGIALHSARA